MRRLPLTALIVLFLAIAAIVVYRAAHQDQPIRLQKTEKVEWQELAARTKAVDRLTRAQAIMKTSAQAAKIARRIRRMNPRHQDATQAIRELIAALGDTRKISQDEVEYVPPERSSSWVSSIGELAAGALAIVGRDAVPPLLEVIGKRKDPARMNAIRALALMENRQASSALTRELGSPDAAYRERIVKLFATWGAPVAPLKHAVRDRDPKVRRAAVAAFPDVAGADVLLLDIAMRDSDDKVRQEAGQAILGMAYNRACDGEGYGAIQHVGWLREPTAEYRARGVRGLGVLHCERFTAALILLLNDKSALVRTSAEQALRDITGKNLGHDPETWKRWLGRRQRRKP